MKKFSDIIKQMKKILDKINLWLNIARGYTIPQSVIPYILAVVLASKHYKIDYFLSFLGLIGVALVHMSVNMLDDYFDWKKGAVAEYKKLAEKGIIAATHKCFYLEENLVTLNQVLVAALSMDAIACLLGFFIATKAGLSIIIIAFVTGLMGFFYSSPPLSLSYRGLGEPVIGIIFGPLLMFGAYITAGANIDKTIILSSIIIGLIVANIAYTHAIMDFDSDIKVGKKSFPILFKTKENAIIVQALIYILAYSFLAAGIFTGVYPLASVLTFITLPKAFVLVKLMKTQDKEKKLWMGIMENWETVQKEGTDWFMLRFFISRNIVTEFIVILGVTYYLFG